MAVVVPGDAYMTVRRTAEEQGLAPAGPGEFGPFKFQCPAVEDHGRSTSCMEGIERGLGVVLFCARGCAPEAIYEAMDLKRRDLRPADDDAAPASRPTNGTAPPQTFKWTTLADVQPRALRWLWRPYFPMGKVSLIVGAPGHGKSQLTAWLAALTTRAAFFDGDVNAPGDVVIVAAEDDLADTVVPRLLAANADMRRVHTVNAQQHVGFKLTAEGLIRLPGDVGVLYDRLQYGTVRLVIFDPVVSYLSRDYKAVANQDVRDAIGPLKALAERFDTAIACILHVNKQSEIREWSARISDSHAWQAVARSIVALGPDPDDEEGEAGSHKVLALPKSNLVKRAGRSMRFEIETAHVPIGNGVEMETSRIVPRGPCDVPADDLLLNDEQRTAYAAAKDFVLDFLADGWQRSGDLKANGIKEGHAWRTVERARAEVCQRPKRQGGRRGVLWVALKTTTTPPPWEQGMGGVGGLDGLEDANSANTARTPDMAWRSKDEDRQDRQATFDLDAYRRHRDAMLGERWDDDDD